MTKLTEAQRRVLASADASGRVFLADNWTDEEWWPTAQSLFWLALLNKVYGSDGSPLIGVYELSPTSPSGNV